MDPDQPGRLLGLVTSENIQEYFAVQQVVAARDGRDKNGRNERV